ncbi:MAG: NAD(+)/NADH kinase [Clostridia bacterium]|nr:NAD(+)/NADH kinase [Clostridia bacterium]
MKVAVLTNKYIKEPEIKNRMLADLSAGGEFEFTEIGDAKDINPHFEKVLVFGGDGTILKAAKSAAGFGIPVVGVDLGRLGFLAEFSKASESSEIKEALLSDETASKMLISASVGDIRQNALNEIVIKSAQSRPVYLDLYIDGDYVDSYHSDGIIISTPTGSTAYSLSAGGPVLSPDVDAMLIIPICPHSLHSKSLVISSSSKVEIKLNRYIDALVSVDGEEVSCIKPGENVIICKSSDKANFIVKNKENFYKRLLNKMNKWGVTE